MRNCVGMTLMLVCGVVDGWTQTPTKTGNETSSRPIIQRALSIQDALELALKQSPVVRGAEEEVNMAVARLNMARSGARPVVSATGFLTAGSEGSIYSTAGPVMPPSLTAVPRGPFFDANATLMYPIYTGGRLQALIRQAKSLKTASDSDLEAMRRDLALEVKTAYRQVLLAQAMQKVAVQRSAATAERLRIDRAAFAEGRIPKSYVLRDEAEHADATQMLTNVRRDVEMAMVMLRTAMGVSAESQITLSDELKPEATSGTATPLQSLKELLGAAEKQRPELRAARQRTAASGSGASSAKSAYRPQLSLMAMGDAMRVRGMEPFTGATFGLVIGLPVLDGGMRKASVDEAKAQQRKAQLDYEKLSLQIASEVQNSWLALQSAEQNIETAQAGVAAADEDYRIAQLRYESGRGLNVEVLDALTALTRARINQAQAWFDYSTGRDRLQRALGR